MTSGYKRDYTPTFHKDGTVTYWDDRYGWRHRVHPVLVKGAIVCRWNQPCRDRLKTLVESCSV